MPLVHWRSDMSVGVEALDEDHRRLFDMVNELYDAVQGGTETAMLGSLFDGLARYAEDHFSREEQLMAACGYPGLAAHRDEHAHLTAKVQELSQRFQEGSLETLNLELLVLFKTWLMSHIRITDFRYKPYVLETSGAGADGAGADGAGADGAGADGAGEAAVETTVASQP